MPSTFDLSALVLVALASYSVGVLSCLLFIMWLGRREDRKMPPAIARMLVQHRIDVHHHGLPKPDDDGENWKRG